MEKVQKVCPVIIRESDGQKEILVFRHPKGDIQIVKGTIEPDEKPELAALRELQEESGIEEVSFIEPRGIWEPDNENQIWHFYLFEVGKKLEDSWTFFANDDGGLNFNFFWFNLNETPSDEWDSLFQKALIYIKTVID